MENNSRLFDNFNARHSTFEEVANTFVSNDDFFQIAQNNHTFVLGPRGCGKTTMFKMLTKTAQYFWNPENEKERVLKTNFPFIAIYIPSDELWKDQLKAVTNSLNSTRFDIFKTVSSALINLNVISNFCVNIKQHIELIEIDAKSDKEYELSLKLIKIWKLEDCIATINDIRLELEIRKNLLLSKVKKYLYQRKQNSDSQIVLEEYYFFDFLDSLKQGILAFEMTFCSGIQNKWAVCFDELELLSEDFLNVIIGKLRITPPNIVFKLSSGPLSEFNDTKAQVFHDFEIVKMWPFSFKEESRYMQFCQKIALKRLVNAGFLNTEKKFENLFARLENIELVEYEQKELDYFIGNLSDFERFNLFLCKKLASIDDSYKSVLSSFVDDVNYPIPKNDQFNDTFFRKTKELVLNRLVFNKYKNGKFHAFRSRKEYLIYNGHESILKICEGNPRFIINIINELLFYCKTEKIEIFSAELQANVIKSISNRFNAMLNTYPTAVLIGNKEIDLKWLIDKVGKYFESEVNKNEFKISPQTCFIIRNKKSLIHREIMELIEIGVGLGAFVKIDQTSDDINIDKYTRYRMSYLLHPNYKLPLRLYSSVNLNKILENKNTANKSKNMFEINED